MAFGAVGNIVSNGLQSNIHSAKDAIYYGSVGAAVNAAGLGIAKAVEKKAAQSFEQLGRQAKRVKLQSIYGDTSRKVLNAKMNAAENFSEVLSGGVIRLTSYGCGTSELTNWFWGKAKAAMYGED